MAVDVIVTFRYRYIYVKGVIDNLKRQSATPHTYFVVMDLDKFYQNVGDAKEIPSFVTVLECKDKYMECIAKAVAEGKSEIITFLEDDDIYTPDRIERIEHFFTKYKFNYFHNNFFPIAKQSGKVLTDAYEDQPRYPMYINSCDILSKMAKRYPNIHHNISSMAVSRDAFLPSLRYLGGIEVPADYLIFLSVFLSANVKVYITNERLTYFRLGGFSTIESPNSFDDFIYEVSKLLNASCKSTLGIELFLQRVELECKKIEKQTRLLLAKRKFIYKIFPPSFYGEECSPVIGKNTIRSSKIYYNLFKKFLKFYYYIKYSNNSSYS